MENLKKDYPWLFKKRVVTGMGRSKKVSIVDMVPEVYEHETHYAVQREKDASPLILSKDYIL